MHLKDKFSKPIYKEDLFRVLKEVLFMSIIGGLLIGSIQVLLVIRFDLSLMWLMLFVLAFLTAKRIKRAINEPHIIYSLLSVFTFILAIYILNLTASLGVYYVFTGSIQIELSYFFQILNPVPYFYFLYPFSGYFFQVNNIFNVVFFIIGIYYAFQYSK